MTEAIKEPKKIFMYFAVAIVLITAVVLCCKAYLNRPAAVEAPPVVIEQGE